MGFKTSTNDNNDNRTQRSSTGTRSNPSCLSMCFGNRTSSFNCCTSCFSTNRSMTGNEQEHFFDSPKTTQTEASSHSNSNQKKKIAPASTGQVGSTMGKGPSPSGLAKFFDTVRYNASFGPLSMSCALKVGLRRRRVGPKFPNWNYKQETVVEFLNGFLRTLASLPPETVLKARATWDQPMPGVTSSVLIEENVPVQFSDPDYEKYVDQLLSTTMSEEALKRVPDYTPSPCKLSKSIMKKLEELKKKSLCPSPALLGEWTSRKPEHEKDDELRERKKEFVILYLHGGAYVLCSTKSHRAIMGALCAETGFKVFAIDYRLAPEFQFPCALEDSVRAYLYLIKEMGYRPENIHVSGDSAGGGLAAALCNYLHDNDLPLPGSVVLNSPWLDLSCSRDSWTRNAEADYLIHPELSEFSANYLYAGDYIKHPYASPIVRTSLAYYPPTLIVCGTRETLYDEAHEFYGTLKNTEKIEGSETNPVPSRFEIQDYDNMPHAFVMLPVFQEALSAYKRISKFMLEHSKLQ